MHNKKFLKVTGIIPARYNAKRLPGKPLIEIAGKPMLFYVYKQAEKSKLLDNLIIAADDIRIKNRMEALGCRTMMTSRKHKSGTDRIAEVAGKINTDIIINIQGDEPLISPRNIDMLARCLLEDKQVSIATLMTELRDSKDARDPNVVKVVTDINNFALYFSRQAIPYDRDDLHDITYYKHIGIYAYRKKTLLKLTKLDQSRLEKSEKLEQLRFMENAYRIKVLETTHDSISVDTHEDLKIVKKIIEKK